MYNEYYGKAPSPGVSVGACPSCPAEAITGYYGGGCRQPQAQVSGPNPMMQPSVGANGLMVSPVGGMGMAGWGPQFWSQPAFPYFQPYQPHYYDYAYMQPAYPAGGAPCPVGCMPDPNYVTPVPQPVPYQPYYQQPYVYDNFMIGNPANFGFAADGMMAGGSPAGGGGGAVIAPL